MCSRKMTIVTFVMMGLMVLFVPTTLGSIIHVDADARGTNNGGSWKNAFVFLQDGLAVAVDGDEIRVAQGVYKPDQGDGITPGDRNASFQLITGVSVKGGYVGLGNTRDIELYETVLSGDLYDNDRPNFSYYGENSYHVVTGSNCDKTAVIEGFTITAGNADSDYPNDVGGGMRNESGSPTVSNCMFTGNSANWGGGMFNYDNSNTTLTNCTFNYNMTSDKGGGMYNYSSNPTLENCTFNDNKVRVDGGGIFNFGSSPMLTNCTFKGNLSTVYSGGGMYNWNDSNPTLIDCAFSGNNSKYTGGGMTNVRSKPSLINCTFSGNSSDYGGGIYTHDGSPMLVNCTFSDNEARVDAAGMYNEFNSNPMLSNCTFNGNSATTSGGGMYNHEGSSPTLTNCIFMENSAKRGGGMRNSNGSPTLINCTFSENSASEHGGGIANASMSSPTLTNCILWADTPQEIIDHAGTSTVTYSDVEGGYEGDGNIDVAPAFVSRVNGDFHLRSLVGAWDESLQSWVPSNKTSPCIDMGNPLSDYSGELWPHGGRINMGAYGGTAEASISESDVGNIANYNSDDGVDYGDFSVFSGEWKIDVLPSKADMNRDGQVGLKDLLIFSDNWLYRMGSIEPICYWNLDEESGDLAADSSSNGHDGTLFNMDDSDWVEDETGNALSFDGVDDFVQVIGYKGIAGTSSRTVCAWIKTTDTEGEIVSWGKKGFGGGRWIFMTQGGGYLGLEVGGGVIVGSTFVCDDQWHHVAVVLENDGTPNINEVKLYVDGVFDAPSSVGDKEINTVLGPDVKIGVWGGGQRFFEGLIDEVRIYDRPLSVDEIAVLAK